LIIITKEFQQAADEEKNDAEYFKELAKSFVFITVLIYWD
jgi:hypothetical protein